MDTLVCIDRDGTLIYDDSYYLGRQDNWKELITFLPGVIEGLQALQEVSNCHLHMITNQSGVAIKQFSQLTEERARVVCEEVLSRLDKHDAGLDGYSICPHVTPEYAERKEYDMSESLICECDCIKPRLGMVFDALRENGVERADVDTIIVIGDRVSDVQTAVRLDGKGILVPFENRLDEVNDVPPQVLVVDDFLEASKHVKRLA